MKQWVNDALLFVSSALFADQLVDYVNQTRLYATDDVLIKRKPSLANRLNWTQDEDAQADELVLMTKQTYTSRHDEAILRDQVYHLKGRLRKSKTREKVAMMRTRAWRERREFLLREQDKLDKKFQEHRRLDETSNHSDDHLKSLKQTLDAASKDKLVSEVRSMQEEYKTLKKTLKAMPASTSQGISRLKILKRAKSEESGRKKAQMENTGRRLEAIKASHSRFIFHQSQINKELRVLTTDMHTRAKHVKLICSKRAKLNQLAQMRLEGLRRDVARLNEDLVPDQEISKEEQRRSKLRNYLKGMAAVLLIEGFSCLAYFMM